MNVRGSGWNSVVRPGGERIFRGWWIALAGTALNALNGALLMQSYGAYFVLLQADFGWSKTLLSGAFAMTRVESGILGPLQGWLTDRFGPRAVLRVGVVLFGVGFMLFSGIETLLGFYVTFLILALGASLGGFITFTVALVHWFERHRTKAIALSQMGFAIGGLAVPLVVLSLDRFGWRSTAFASGVGILCLGLPLAQLVRHRPEDVGEVRDGVPRQSGESGPRPLDETAPTADFTTREALATPAFWLISLGHASALLVVSAVMVHLVPHLTESLGLSLATAGAMVALMTALQVLGQISGGYLGDRFDKRALVVACMLAHGVGLWVLAYGTSLWSVAGFALLHGWAWGARGPQMVSLRADYFGAASFGTIMGFSSLIVMLGMTLGPLVAGFLADRTGSYTPGFALLGLGAGLGSLFFALARPPRRETGARSES